VNESKQNKVAEEGAPAPGSVRIVITIEGPVIGETNLTVAATGTYKDGTFEGPSLDGPFQTDSLMAGVMLASAELHKLGLLMGYDIVTSATAGKLFGTGEGIENAHAAADFAAGEESE
jgi:hypothetical protein